MWKCGTEFLFYNNSKFNFALYAVIVGESIERDQHVAA